MKWTDKTPTEDGVYLHRWIDGGAAIAMTIADGRSCYEVSTGQWLGPLALIEPDELAELRRKAAAFDMGALSQELLVERR